MTTDIKQVVIGEITGVHGIRGRVKIRVYSDNPKNLEQYETLQFANGGLVSIKATSYQDEIAIVEIEGITKREQAEKLVGQMLSVPRSALKPTEENQYYIEDLIGLQVFKDSGRLVGVVVACHNYGAGDILELKYNDGVMEMYNFDHKTFPIVDITNKRIVFNRPDEFWIRPEDAPKEIES